MGQRSLIKTHNAHGYRGRDNSRGKRLLSKLGNLTPLTRIEELLKKISNEKKDQYEGEF